MHREYGAHQVRLDPNFLARFKMARRIHAQSAFTEIPKGGGTGLLARHRVDIRDVQSLRTMLLCPRMFSLFSRSIQANDPIDTYRDS
jgi:hypothetical protein